MYCAKVKSVQWLAMAFMYAAFTASVSAGTIHVAPGGNDTTGDGSAANPYLTIAKGIEATGYGDVVSLADGVYTGAGNTNLILAMPYAAIQSDNGPGNCIIDCENQSGSTGFTIIALAGNFTLTGLTIRNAGNAGVSIPNPVTYFHPTIHVELHGMVIRACGEGLHGNCFSGVIQNCSIIGNRGTAFYSARFNGSLTNNTIADNDGHAVYNFLDGFSGLIANNTITGNASGIGGHYYSVTIRDNFLRGRGDGYGIQAYENSCQIVNNVICNFRYGVLLTDAFGMFINNTIVGNETGVYFDSSTVYNMSVVNTILWNTVPGQEIVFQGMGGTIDISYSCVRGGAGGISAGAGYITLVWGAGNIESDPRFVDYGSWNLHLADASPCIGAGRYDVESLSDIEGVVRGIPPDIGAYENPLNSPLAAVMTVAEAAAQGYIGPYCYIWHECQREYQPVDPFESVFIEPWTGFWVDVKADVDFLVPKSSYHHSTPATDAPSHMEKKLLNNHWYLLSLPLQSSCGGDCDAIFGDILGSGQYEEKWRASKWDNSKHAYCHYTGPGCAFPALIPGRGFWLHQKSGGNKDITLNGWGANPLGENYELQLPCYGHASALHMVGNPYWYAIKWRECKIRVPMTDTLPLGKIATGTVEPVDKWFVTLMLESEGLDACDTFNRAGVLQNFDGDAMKYNALDFTPPDDYVRLTLSDPAAPGKGPFAYDYRPDGQNQYKWEIELSTTYDTVTTVFSIGSVEMIPPGYTATIESVETMERYDLTSAMSIPVALTSNIAKHYILTVTETPVAVADVSKPLSFGINGITPNPFNPATTIEYSLESDGNVLLRLYTLNGQLVDTLVREHQTAGRHHCVWKADGQASGVYFIVLETGGRKDVGRATFLK